MEDASPSTSKQDAKQDRHDGGGSDRKTNSNSNDSVHTNFSWHYSSGTNSNIDMANMGLHISKPGLKKREDKYSKHNERDRKEKNRVGVNKRKNVTPKRNNTRRAVTKKPQNKKNKRKRDLSISTIFTRLSSGSRSHVCHFCGHRCCGRRSGYCSSGRDLRRYKRHNRRNKKHKKDLRTIRDTKRAHGKKVVAIQVGSCAHMLSPLFVKTNAMLEEHQEQKIMHSEISPEMIYEALRNLSMWREEVKTEAILDYIKNNYPANRNSDELLKDLEEKLRIAALVGIVIRLPRDSWRLTTALQKRSLTETHVSIFWHAYGDTMKPIILNRTSRVSREADKENQTESCDLVTYK